MLGNFQVKAMLATANPEAARHFYGEVLGLSLVEEHPFAILYDSAGIRVHIQKVTAFTPQPFTAMGWTVPDVTAAATELARKGVRFERFEGMTQDDLGIWIPPGGATGVCWFKDPDGNLLSLS